MKKHTKRNLLIQVALVAAIVVIVNLISANVFRRIDLTDDNRHTVSNASREYLDSLDQNVFVSVYYGGELPTHYKQLENEMRTFLEELSLHSGGKLDYQFVDPTADPGIFRRFAEKGFYPFRVSMPTSYTTQQDIQVLPYAQVSYKQKEVMINLIHNCTFMSQSRQPDFSPECAIQRFEYNLLTTIYNLSREKYKTIGLLSGHGEYPKEAMGDLLQDIDHYYNIIDVKLFNGKAIGPSNLDLLLVMQPQVALTEREKYEIDQYVMRGGKVIFCMDQEILDFTIGEQASTLTNLRATNLDDEFMKWGVKLNYNIVKDMECGMISTTSYTAAFGNESRKAYWPYYPIIRNLAPHPVTRYLDRLLIRYGGSIDTFMVDGVQKTVLFKSSARTWLKDGRQFINIDQEIRAKPNLEQYISGGQIMGLILEGDMPSNFVGRTAPIDSFAPIPPQEPFLPKVAENRKPMVVIISDGEFATGDNIGGRVARLPEENKQFMTNLIDIMTGQELLTKLRVREFNDRELDREKIIGNETYIRLLNIGLPVLLVIIFGLVRSFLRKRKNAQLQQKS